jgi:hypothetical protein
MGIAQPAVADQRKQPVAAVRQLERPEFVKPGPAKGRVDYGGTQDDADAGNGDRTTADKLARSACPGGRLWKGA